MWDALTEIASRVVESAQGLLIVLGVTVLVLGLAGGITYKEIFPIPQTEWRALGTAAGLLLVFISVAFLGRSSPTISSAARYGIKITAPGEGNHVGITNVEGTIKRKFSVEYALYMIRIYPDSNRLVPMGVADVNYKTGAWRAIGCNIGGRPGNARIIGAYLVGPSGRVLFDYYNQVEPLVRMLRNDAQKPDVRLPPLTRTADMIECDRVGVIRANS
jgi:hypothetical protein